MNKLTDEQLSALSIFLEIEVVELFNMTMPEIKKKINKAVKSKKMNLRDCLRTTGAYRMLYDQESDLDKLVLLLEK